MPQTSSQISSPERSSSPIQFPDLPSSRRFSYAPFVHELLDLNVEMKLTREEVDQAVQEVLRAKWKVGLEGKGFGEGGEVERERLERESEEFWSVRRR